MSILTSEPSRTHSIEHILSPEQLRRMKVRQELDRRNIGDTFDGEMRRTFDFGTGDYQRLLTLLDILHPIDIVEESERYVQDLLELGVPRVEIVDFGCGAAKTMVSLGNRLESLVASGKVRITATNLFAAPTREEIDDIDRRTLLFDRHKITPEHVELLRKALAQKTINFLKADIVDLFEYLKDPVHLFFSLNTSTPMAAINDSVLKVVSEMVDPNFGSIVIDRDTLDNTPFNAIDKDLEGRSRKELFKEGEGYIRRKGFVDKGVYLSPGARGISVFQGPKSPPFRLSRA